MLVRVRNDFAGTFGYYLKEYNTVIPKRAGDEPFDVPEHVAREQIHNNVLEAVGAYAPAAEEFPFPEALPEELPVAETEEVAPVQQKDITDMSWSELKAEAKARGIKFVGVNAETLRKLIEEYDAEDAPAFEAEDPV